jgi:hypothetical protein
MSNGYTEYDQLHRGKAHRYVRILPVGFLIDGALQPDLRGEVVRIRFVRKCFEARSLVCHSTDGLQAHMGFDCRTCQKIGCRPFVRLQLADAARIYTVDLAAESARRLLQLVDDALKDRALIIGVELRLTVLPLGCETDVYFQYV